MMAEQKPTIIFLARHGQSEWNGKKRISGQMDPPLSQKGMQQAKALAKVLQDEHLSAIYTSTLARTIETAEPTAVSHQIRIQKKAALKEIHFGILQGRFRDQRDPEAERFWVERTKERLTYRIPEGETFPELEQRVIPCLNNVLKSEAGEAVLIVGHRNTNRVILGALMCWSSEHVVTLGLRSKYLYRITLSNEPSIQTISLDMKKNGLKYNGFKT